MSSVDLRHSWITFASFELFPLIKIRSCMKRQIYVNWACRLPLSTNGIVIFECGVGRDMCLDIVTISQNSSRGFGGLNKDGYFTKIEPFGFFQLSITIACPVACPTNPKLACPFWPYMTICFSIVFLLILCLIRFCISTTGQVASITKYYFVSCYISFGGSHHERETILCVVQLLELFMIDGDESIDLSQIHFPAIMYNITRQ